MNLEVRREVSNAGPITYQGALEEGQKRTATMYEYQAAVKGKKLSTSTKEQHLYAITEEPADNTLANNRSSPGLRKCYNCQHCQGSGKLLRPGDWATAPWPVLTPGRPAARVLTPADHLQRTGRRPTVANHRNLDNGLDGHAV